MTGYQYRTVEDALLTEAQAVVWLDHPCPLVAWRLLRRSVVRAVSRSPLYNGNGEQVRTWARASHPLRIVLSREFWAQRRRTEAELARGGGPWCGRRAAARRPAGAALAGRPMTTSGKPLLWDPLRQQVPRSRG